MSQMLLLSMSAPLQSGRDGLQAGRPPDSKAQEMILEAELCLACSHKNGDFSAALEVQPEAPTYIESVAVNYHSGRH